VSEQPVIDISGFFKSFSIGSLTVPIYFLIPSFAFIICLFWLVKRAERRHLSRNRALDLSLVLMVCGFLFARLFHVFFEEPAYYAEDPMRVFDLWRGGFVWYGGALFGALGAVLFLKWKREPIGRWLDLFAPLAAGGYAMGRLACLCVGCCYGKTFAIGEHIIRHPTQLYSSLLEALTLVVLLWQEKHLKLREGELFVRWVLLHSINRLIVEQFRDDPRGPMLLGFSIATWISLALILAMGSVTFMGERKGKVVKNS